MSIPLSSRRVLTQAAIVLLLAFAGLPPPAAAAAIDVRLRDYVHTTWTHYDGTPLGTVKKVLQTSDGYLWIFADELLRFDGMRFVRAKTPCTQRIRSQTAAADGGLWIVCGEKLVRRTAAGRFVVALETLAGVEQHSLLADRQGRLWLLGNTIRYLEEDGSDLRTLDGPRAQLSFVGTQDSGGTIWATDRTNIYQLSDNRVEFVQPLEGARCLTPARAGGIFVASGKETEAGATIWHLRKGARASVVRFPDVRVTTPNEDCIREGEDGGLWLAASRSLVVLARGNRVETFPDSGPYQGAVREVFIDRAGAIWAGSTSGLHRLRKPTVQLTRLPPEHGQPVFVFIDSLANLWTGSSTGTYRSSLRDGIIRPVTPQVRYLAVGDDETGTVWLSNEKAIGRVVDGAFVAVADVTGAPIVDVSAFATDERGNLWAASYRVGVYRVTPGPPRLVAASQLVAHDFLPSAQAGTWTALRSGGVEHHINGQTLTLPNPNPALPYVSPMAMLREGETIWLASYSGLERLRNGKWTTWNQNHGLPADGRVNAIIPDSAGNFWMMTAGGILRLPRGQLDATPDGSPRPLSFARIGLLDGVVPHPGNLRSSPLATSDRDGRLYFTTVDGIAIVDPAAVTESSMVAPIALESVVVDNEAVDPEAPNRFVEPSRLHFEYTSPGLHSPELARFRYRLEGYDIDWIEAGAQRQVTYGTLRPGEYRFRVIGAGAEGVWNETGASYAFHIAPVFWRTWWFQLLMAALGLSIITGLYQLRIRQVTRQYNAGLEARVGERTRIARELHDTLLQTFQGVVIHFQAATNLLPGRPDEARLKFERALEQAGQAITEGRDAVQAMRESAAVSDDLPRALSDVASQLLADRPDDGPAILVSVEGTSCRLHPIVRDDVYRIAIEAMRNAAHHAEARTIQVDVHYDRRCLRLRVRDDGKGIDAAVLEGRGVSGHWGLPGMRERAELIGGTLDIRSRVGAGTEVELSLPALKAYATPGRAPIWSRK